MTAALQAGIFRKQSLAKGFQRLLVIFHFVSSRTGVELDLVRRARLRMVLQRLLKCRVGIVEFLLLI